VPVQCEEFLVDGDGGLELGGADALLELSEELLIPFRD